MLDFGVIGVGNDSWISSTTLGSVILFLSRKSTLYSYQSLLQMNTNSILVHELIFILNIVNNSDQYIRRGIVAAGMFASRPRRSWVLMITNYTNYI